MVVGVVNYGMGNIHSVLRKLKLVGANYKLIESPNHFENVDKIILPGVGHFGQAMENLKRKEFTEPLHKFVITDKKTIRVKRFFCFFCKLRANSTKSNY